MNVRVLPPYLSAVATVPVPVYDADDGRDWGGGMEDNLVVSPAATAATAWVPQPVAAAPASVSMLDAIADAMFGPVAGVMAGQATSAGDAQLAQQQLAMQAFVPQVPQAVAAVAPAPAPVAVPLDPTLVASVTAALAGYGSGTGRSIAKVAGSGISKARRVGTEIWAGVRSPRAVHVSQVHSKYNTAPASGNRDCGPASVAMALRLVNRTIPGASAKTAPQGVINAVRRLAGNIANGVSTTNHELGRALRAAGTTTREIADGASVRQAVMAGKPVVLNGNPRNPGAYGPSFGASQMVPYNGAHWVVVSGFDTKLNKYIINDPLSKVGPVKVTPAQLEAYRGGSLGIEVTA